MQDLAWGRRYEQVLGALLCLCGAKMRAELNKQTQLVELLGGVAERVRQAGSSARQVGVFKCVQCSSVCVCIFVECVFMGVCPGSSARRFGECSELLPEE